MTDCEKLSTCEFMKVYSNEESRKLALAGFVRTFCKGPDQNGCLRKKVSKELGGSDRVPKNMMPTGRPLSGTTDEKWSEDVKRIIKVSFDAKRQMKS
jgi:hypothetical protein